ncbi:hypothetical protein AYY23_08180 [Photobacterium kishitanii]|nr:hypothetical protein AYY23_08180 [Photobacterium kishitanii]
MTNYNNAINTTQTMLEFIQYSRQHNVLFFIKKIIKNDSEDTINSALAHMLLYFSCQNIMNDIPLDRIDFEIEQALRKSSKLRYDIRFLRESLTHLD